MDEQEADGVMVGLRMFEKSVFPRERGRAAI
jgi:hypothetical protein